MSISHGCKKTTRIQNKAFCFACKKSIDLHVMGESALVSHMKGMKHEDYVKRLQGNEKTIKISDFFSSSASTTVAQATANRQQQLRETSQVATAAAVSSWLKCNTEGGDLLDT